MGDIEKILLAEIKIEKVIKSHKLLKGKPTIQVFYLAKAEKETDSLKYIDLSQGQRSDFYLDVRPLFEGKDVLFLDEQLDVRQAGTYQK